MVIAASSIAENTKRAGKKYPALCFCLAFSIFSCYFDKLPKFRIVSCSCKVYDDFLFTRIDDIINMARKTAANLIA